MFTNTSISKSSQFWTDSDKSRARLAEGNTFQIQERATRNNSVPILDIWGDMDCVTIFAGGFILPSNDSLYPLSIEWILVPCVTCIFDTDMPLASAVTIFTAKTEERAGCIFKMSGFRMDRAILYARIIGDAGTPQVTAALYALADMRGCHRTNIEIGSVIG